MPTVQASKKITVIICLSSLLLCTIAIGIPYLVFKSSLRQTIDKGILLGEPELSHTFFIPNWSWRAINVGKATPSCGCTVVGALPKLVQPFHRLKVPLVIDLSGRSGNLTSTVSVDLGRGQVAELSVTADIVAPLPEKIELGKRNQGELIARTYVLPKDFPAAQSVSAPPLASNDSVSIKFEQSGANKLVQIAFKVPEGGGNFEIPIRILTTAETSSEHSITGYALRAVEAKPALLSLGYIQKDSVANGFVNFNSSYGKRFRLRPELCKHSEYVNVKDATDGEELRADIRLSKIGTSGIYKETLDFYFEEAEDPKQIVTVPVELYAYQME